MSPSLVTWTVLLQRHDRHVVAELRPERGRVGQRRQRVEVAADDQDRHVDLHGRHRAAGAFDAGQSRQTSYGCEKPLIVSHSAAVNGANASGAPAKDVSRG